MRVVELWLLLRARQSCGQIPPPLADGPWSLLPVLVVTILGTGVWVTDVPAPNPGAWLPCPSFHCDVSLILVLLASSSLCDPGDPGDTRRHFDTTVDFLICAHPSILGLSLGISSVCGGGLRGGGPPPPVVLLLSPLWCGPGPCGCSVGVGSRALVAGLGAGAGGNLEIALMK